MKVITNNQAIEQFNKGNEVWYRIEDCGCENADNESDKHCCKSTIENVDEISDPSLPEFYQGRYYVEELI